MRDLILIGQCDEFFDEPIAILPYIEDVFIQIFVQMFFIM